MGTGDRIRTLREEAGLAQEALARACDVSRNTVHRWETGVVQPRFETLPVLAKALGVEVGDLFPDPEEVSA